MKKSLLSILLLTIACSPLFADTYSLPDGNNNMLSSNLLLPQAPHEGIVVNLSEMRLYYFPKNSGVVMTYPVGIGKVGKTIPVGHMIVSKKVLNPTWTPTPDIRAYNREKGIMLPASIPPGPDNPLGPYAIYLGSSEYRIHSTLFPESIGRRASFGCIRMKESDIKDFFPLVKAKTQVSIVDFPTKVGWYNNQLYLEAHAPLEENPAPSANYGGMVELIARATQGKAVLVDWQLVDYLSEIHDGEVHDIGMSIRG